MQGIRSSDKMEKDNQDQYVIHTGGCHCGTVRFEAQAASKLKIYVCNCSICVKKQIKAFVVPDERFKILSGRDNLTLYTFNTGAAKHYFCKTCGVQSFYKPRSNPNGISVMLFCIDSKTIEGVEEMNFDGQNWEEAINTSKPACS
ncbi:centromere protein V-like [Uloborus diversus]|uniref:centromere protein V-like n=1 Tax=Uloborus diversus TaxID=327109 RepID=UPI0024092622|nr:centromere protein V-like [Uloborus diversus]